MTMVWYHNVGYSLGIAYYLK